MPDLSLGIPAGLLASAGAKMMPPCLVFGSPLQRAKNEAESFWHIPVRIEPGRLWGRDRARRWGPAAMPGCEVYLEQTHAAPTRIRLCWGDAGFENPLPIAALRRHHTTLVPIAFRSEEDGQAYWTDIRFFQHGERALPIPGDRSKQIFRLCVKSGSFVRSSAIQYQLRAPFAASNGHFVLEQIFDADLPEIPVIAVSSIALEFEPDHPGFMSDTRYTGTDVKSLFVRMLAGPGHSRKVENCRAYLSGVFVRDDNSAWRPTAYTGGQQLAWSHIGFKSVDLVKGVSRHLDVFKIDEPQNIIVPCIENIPNSAEGTFVPGRTYRFDVVVVSGNDQRKMASLEVTQTEQWNRPICRAVNI